MTGQLNLHNQLGQPGLLDIMLQGAGLATGITPSPIIAVNQVADIRYDFGPAISEPSTFLLGITALVIWRSISWCKARSRQA